MCVNLLDVYTLLRVVGEGGTDDGVEERHCNAERTIWGENGERLNVEVVGSLMRRCYLSGCGGERGGSGRTREGFEAALYASYDFEIWLADHRHG